MCDQKEGPHYYLTIEQAKHICTNPLHLESFVIIKIDQHTEICWHCHYEQKMPKGCTKCEICLHDWLEQDMIPGDVFLQFINPKQLKKEKHWIAKEFTRFLLHISPLDEYVLEHQIAAQKREYNNTEEDTNIFITYKATYIILMQSPFKNDLQYICDSLQDKGVFRTGRIVGEWLGMWFHFLRTTMKGIHKEHSGQQEIGVTGGHFTAPGL